MANQQNQQDQNRQNPQRQAQPGRDNRDETSRENLDQDKKRPGERNIDQERPQ